MKRWFSLAAALLMLFAFSACGEAPPSDTLPTVQPIGIVDMLTAEQIYGATGLRFGAAQQATAVGGGVYRGEENDRGGI